MKIVVLSDNNDVPKSAWLLLFVALFAVSSAGAVLQSMGEIPPILRASWRMQGTALILLPGFIYQLYSYEKGLLNKQDLGVIVLSSLFLAAHFGSWVWSLDHTSLVHSLLFVTSHPLVVVLLMPILGSEIRKGHVIGASVGFFGAALTLKDIDAGGEVTLIGNFFAFIGAVTVVGYLFSGRYLRSERNIPLFIYAFPVTFLSAVWLTPSSMVLEGTNFSQTIPELGVFGWLDISWIIWVGYLSLGPGLLGHTGINAVLRWFSPLIVSIALLFEPVIGGLIGWAWNGNISLGIWTLIGGCLMLVGAMLVKFEEANEQTIDESPS
jgi:drug/metabolite transporter (DMT)-like permease